MCVTSKNDGKPADDGTPLPEDTAVVRKASGSSKATKTLEETSDSCAADIRKINEEAWAFPQDLPPMSHVHCA